MRLLASFAAGLGLALVASRAARAQEPAPLPARGSAEIRVSATGEARAVPDRAFADFGVETEAPSAQQAAADNARRMEQVIAALVRAGISRAEIQTRDFSVFPAYDPQPPPMGGEPRVRGYRVTNTVTVRTDEVQRVGALIDAALAAGANRSYGLRFDVRDPQRLRNEALRDAMRRARAEAETIAQALGVQLVRVVEASTVSEPMRPVIPMMARAAAMDMAQTPVEPGQATVQATVTLVYAVN